jgi:hypothetical protein
VRLLGKHRGELLAHALESGRHSSDLTFSRQPAETRTAQPDFQRPLTGVALAPAEG